MSHQPEISGNSPRRLLADIPRHFLLCLFILPYVLHICWPSCQRGEQGAAPHQTDLLLAFSMWKPLTVAKNLFSSESRSPPAHSKRKFSAKIMVPFCQAGHELICTTRPHLCSLCSISQEKGRGGGWEREVIFDNENVMEHFVSIYGGVSHF